MRKTVYAFVALALVGLGVAAYPRASKPAALAESGDLHASLARLRGELAEERAARQREIAKLEARLRVLAMSSAQDHDGQLTATAPAAALEPAEQAEQEQPEPIDPGEHLEHAFGDQPTDAAWANATEAHIAQKVRAGLPHARVQAIECHASMCRLETIHADAAAYGQFVNESKRLWSADAYSDEPIEGAQGQLVVVSYLAREGETLPQIR
jgi:hypothetical protein